MAVPTSLSRDVAAPTAGDRLAEHDNHRQSVALHEMPDADGELADPGDKGRDQLHGV
jgi:hypothetical protein